MYPFLKINKTFLVTRTNVFITAAQRYNNESYKRDVVTRYFPYIFCEKIQVLFQLGLV